MKIIFAFALFTSTLAHAGYVCDSGDKGPGPEYYLRMDTPNKEVIVMIQTATGVKALSTLSCTSNPITPPPGPIIPIVICSDKAHGNIG